MKNIITFGSCLSATVANQLEVMGDFYRVSSVQHNRIDQFMENYVYKTSSPLKEEDMGLKVKENFQYVNVFRNQFDHLELGKALPFKREQNSLMHPINAINDGNIKLLLIDNYPDMFFKVYKHKTIGSKFFINKGYLEEEPSSMEFVNKLLDPKEASELYNDLISYCESKNDNLITVFMHFPVNLKMNDAINKREKDFIASIEGLKEKHDQFFVISPKEITIEDLSNPKDPYHYKDETYKKYALEIKELLRQNELILG
ncbi:hypothetical protein [Neobacillus cucumis]|uniref:GSCFA domain-containing protein n=1 Tax=Neobacillus cucumis TaxID=1740721 RepID=A0A2N5H7L5_9BACI|nr:hypothetical protein [Neobacillus cucumis]PLS01500.1 hypothetical protein CVD27_24905 [Neobacillus cucumis]